MATKDANWYYQPSTGKVFQGKATGWDDRIGLHHSEADARAALDRVPSAIKPLMIGTSRTIGIRTNPEAPARCSGEMKTCPQGNNPWGPSAL